MLEPAVALTDYALTVECLIFVLILTARMRVGNGGRITALFIALFASLSVSSALGGTYHGFFSDTQSALGKAIWLATLLSIGAVSFFTWVIAAEIQLTPSSRRLVFWIAAVEFLGFAIYVTLVSRAFLVASINTVPAMIFLLAGYVQVIRRGAARQVWLGLFGLLVAFAGAVMQQVKIGFHPDYFDHNAVYHVVQFTAFALIFASITGLEKRKH